MSDNAPRPEAEQAEQFAAEVAPVLRREIPSKVWNEVPPKDVQAMQTG
ncbi:hypothetical protein [Paenibacillus sp. MBLB4367]